MTEKMIDPNDLQELLDEYDSGDQDKGALINGLRALLPKPDYPEDMFGMWTEHAGYGRVLVCDSKPDGNGWVAIAFRDDRRRTGGVQIWVDHTTLSFPEPHPETLTTQEDYKNAPEGTIVARDHERAWTKLRGEWRAAGVSSNDIGMRDTASRVLRWGWGQ